MSRQHRISPVRRAWLAACGGALAATAAPIGAQDTDSDAAIPANITQSNQLTQEQWGFSGIRNPTIPFRGGPTPASCLPPYSFPSIVFGPAEPLCGFDAASVIDTIPDSEKINAIGRFTWQATPTDQVFVEGTYYHGRFVQRIAPSPLYSPFEPGNDFTLPPSSPFYPTGYVAGLPGGDPTQRLEIPLCTRRCQGRSTRACATRSGRRRCSLYPRRPRPACDTAAGPRRSSGHSVDRSQTVWPTR